MKKRHFIWLIPVLILGFLISCDNNSHEEDDLFEEEFENEEYVDEEQIADLSELEDKMEEIMVEEHDSDSEVYKDVVVIKSGGAKSVDVELKIGTGKLVLSGGSSELLTGGFIYTKKSWKPKIKYKHKNEKGDLLIEQPGSLNFSMGNDDKYAWNMKFNEKILFDFDIELGAGLSEIYLSDLYVDHFNMVMGVGQTIIDLRGNWRKSAKIHLEGGIGLSKIYLPDNVGVKLEVKKGIGGIDVKNMIKKKKSLYVNEAYEKSDILIKIYLVTGIGKIEVE